MGKTTRTFFEQSYMVSSQRVTIIIGSFMKNGDSYYYTEEVAENGCQFLTWGIRVLVDCREQLLAEGETFAKEVAFNDSPLLEEIKGMILNKVEPEVMIQEIQTMRNSHLDEVSV